MNKPYKVGAADIVPDAGDSIQEAYAQAFENIAAAIRNPICEPINGRTDIIITYVDAGEENIRLVFELLNAQFIPEKTAPTPERVIFH